MVRSLAVVPVKYAPSSRDPPQGHGTVKYSCSGRRSGPPQTSQQSPDISITFKALPTATVSILSPPAPHYPGDTVTLQCDISQHEDWNYYFWEIQNQDYKDCTNKTCSKKLDQYGFHYSCEGRRSGRPRDSQSSARSSITVTALPKATLTVTPNPVYLGETVSLKCSVESGASWGYRWYKDGTEITVEQSGRHRISGDSLTISKVESSDQGQYWCRGELRSIFSRYSDLEYLNVNALPTATVNISPPAPHYPGDTVTLQCDIPQYEDWNYFWFINDQAYDGCTSKNCSTTLGVDTVKSSCEGRRSGRPQDSQRSAILSITVKALPTATLTVTPNPVYLGETVSLKCSVESGASWSYRWYKDISEIRVKQSGRYRISGDSLAISEIELSDQGQYWCRGELRSLVSRGNDSEYLHVNALPTATVNIISSPPAPLYPGDTVTLQCDISEYEDWSYIWLMTGLQYNGCTSKTCSTTLGHDTVQYSCEGRRRGRPLDSHHSAVLSITVTVGPVILESPVHPVTEGDSVTLRCRHKTPPSSPKVDFYKDGNLIRKETTGEMTIPAVSQSDEGLYKCTYSDREQSPQSLLLVRGAVPSIRVGLVVGLVITGVLLFLLILLLLGWRKFKGAQSSAASISSQSQNTNHVLNGVQIANQNQAPGGNSPLQHGQGVEAGPSDLTYAQIELKKMKKP